MSEALRLTAIIPATNGAPTIQRCRAAIEAAERAPEEVLIVDGPANAGPAAARNDGARRSTGDVLLFVDADVLVDRDACARIRAAFEADPALTAVFGSYDDEPSESGTVSTFRNLLHHHVHTSSPGPVRTFWAGLGAIRRDVFLSIGGFDSASFGPPSVEDVELGMRLTDAGHRIALLPEVRGRHLKRWGLRDMVRSDIFDRGVPWTMLLLRRGDFPAVLNLRWRHRLSAASAVAAAGLLLGRRLWLAPGPLALMLLLNRSFYALLWRREGPRGALAGIPLHVLHHLCGAASLPIAGLRHFRLKPDR